MTRPLGLSFVVYGPNGIVPTTRKMSTHGATPTCTCDLPFLQPLERLSHSNIKSTYSSEGRHLGIIPSLLYQASQVLDTRPEYDRPLQLAINGTVLRLPPSVLALLICGCPDCLSSHSMVVDTEGCCNNIFGGQVCAVFRISCLTQSNRT